jgi:IS4 transposase
MSSTCWCRSRRLLHHGSRLHRLRAVASLAPGRQFLRHSRQVEPALPAALLQESDRAAGIICDQIGTLTGFYSAQGYPAPLRRVRVKDDEGKTLVFLTNNTDLPARTIAELYRCRWQVELFFKWIKQHLRIKSFFGTSENAVKSQIWIAVSVYVLVAILKKRLKLSASLYEILQILSLTMFERTPLDQLLARIPPSSDLLENPNQLILFD